MPVVCPSQPPLAYEMLCHLAMHLKALGREPVILDGASSEAAEHRHAHGGLQQVLDDPTVSGVGAASDGHEWLVMPAATGIRMLQQTALAAGGAVALSRLLTPFAPGALLLLFAPVHELAPLMGGLPARVLVPLPPMPQTAVDAYGAVKLLHLAGATPVLAPLATEATMPLLAQVLGSVTDCARRHLGLDIECWSEPMWATGVQEAALGRPQRQDTFHGLRDPRFAGPGSPPGGVVPTLWS